jgi:hypothetical protein
MPIADVTARPWRDAIGRNHRKVTHRCNLQISQIVRHCTKSPDDLCVSEIPSCWIAGAAECDRSDMGFAARHHLGAHHRKVRTNAFDWLARSRAIFSRNKGQRDEVGYFRHINPRAQARAQYFSS